MLHFSEARASGRGGFYLGRPGVCFLREIYLSVTSLDFHYPQGLSGALIAVHKTETRPKLRLATL